MLARGVTPLPQAVRAFKLLQHASGKVEIPVAFVTNATGLVDYKASQLTEWLGVKVIYGGRKLIMIDDFVMLPILFCRVHIIKNVK